MTKLADLLGTELFTSVTEKLGADRTLAIVKGDGADGSWIPKEKFDTVRGEAEGLTSQLTERDKQLVTLTEAAKGNEELTAALEAAKAANAEAATESAAALAALTLKHAVDDALKDAGAHRAIVAMLDMSKVSMVDGKVDGLAPQLDALKVSDAVLFTPAAKLGSEQSAVIALGAGGVNPFKAGDHFNVTEQARLFKENPELAAQLQAEA